MATGIIPAQPLIVNPNLLDNWCFAGANLPVNSRGQTSYTNTGTEYMVDRWVSRGTLQATVEDDGLHFSTSSESLKLLQQPSQSLLADLTGKTVTASILVKDYNMTATTAGSTTYPRFGIYSATSYGYTSHGLINAAFNGNGLFSVTGVLTPTAGDTFLQFAIHLNNSTGTMTVVAAKLEIGDRQTLAHLDNGTWVLNDVPSYDEQLLRCKTATEHAEDPEANKTVEMTDRFLVLTSDTLTANSATWTASAGGMYYTGLSFGSTDLTGYHAVSATLTTFTNYNPSYAFQPYIRNNGTVGMLSAANTFTGTVTIAVRAIFEKN